MGSAQDRIFVQISSYRDNDLPNTIRSALENADRPGRLSFGICWQFDDRSYTELDPYINDKRFRIFQVYYEDSLGCCWARHQTNRLYRGEEFTLQIDAHTRFAPDWDSRYLRMLRTIDSEKPLLTTYPAPFETVNGRDKLFKDRGVQRLKLRRIRKDLTTCLKTEAVKNTDRCVPSQFIGAGQIFTLGGFCEEIEYDPELYFDGEEINLTARAYTHGYDLFCPNEDLIWHRYKHKMPTHWSDHGNLQQEVANDRIHQLLVGDHKLLDNYGLGSARSLTDFEEYVEIDFSERVLRKPVPTHFRKTIQLDVSKVADREDYLFWIFTLKNVDEKEIYRYDINDKRILRKQITKLDVDLHLEDEPVSYMVWPYVNGEGYLDQHHRDL